MVDQHVLASRLNALESYLARLEAFRQIPRDEFLNDEDLFQLAERLLHLACECVIDAAQHVISQQGFRQPNDYKDSMRVLREEGILEADLAERLQGWMGFRNVLVHLYLEIEHERSYKAIQDDLGDLEAFAARLARFLEA